MNSKDRGSNPLDYSIPARTGLSHVPGWVAWPIILIGVVWVMLSGVKIGNRTEDAKRAAAKQDISALGTAIDNFNQDTGRYPTTGEGLAALSKPPPNVSAWRGPYVGQPVINDPWGHRYIYQFSGTHNPKRFDLYSMGPDGTKGNADDIGNW